VYTYTCTLAVVSENVPLIVENLLDS